MRSLVEKFTNAREQFHEYAETRPERIAALIELAVLAFMFGMSAFLALRAAMLASAYRPW